jgi:hypothetical protein
MILADLRVISGKEMWVLAYPHNYIAPISIEHTERQTDKRLLIYNSSLVTLLLCPLSLSLKLNSHAGHKSQTKGP